MVRGDVLDAPRPGAPATSYDVPASRRAAHPASRLRTWAGGLGAAWLAAAILLAGPWLTPAAKEVLSTGLFVLFPLPGVVFCLQTAAATRGRLRRCWQLVALTLGSWAAGNVVWFYDHVISPVPSFPSPADPAYLVALVALTVALARFPTGHQAAGRARLLLDATVVVVALGFTSWMLALHSLLLGGGGVVDFLSAAYPVTDVLIASLAVLLLTRTSSGLRLDLALMATGLVAYAIADTGAALQWAAGTQLNGTVLDLGWLAGYLLIGLAPLAPSASREEDGAARAAAGLLGSVPVYVITGVALAVGMTADLDHVADQVLAGALILAVTARQAVLHRDHAALQRDLAGRVAERTAELDRLSHRHARILDAVGDGVLGVDATGVVSFANPAASRLLGAAAADLVGRHTHQALHPADVPAEDCPSCTAEACVGAAAHEIPRIVVPYVRRTATGPVVFPADVTAAPLRAPDGSRLGSVVVFADDSERHALERMKSEFVTIASHELRTPLTAVRFSLALLEEGQGGTLPPAAARLVGTASDAAGRLHRLIHDILDLERIDAGALPLSLRDVPAADLVRTAVDLVEQTALDAGVAIRTATVRGRVHADADRIVQALTNLVHNAVKFSEPGAAVIVDAEPVPGGLVRFRVTDSGRGIPEDKIDAVFGRFQQVDDADSAEKGGAGLGLAITRSLVERHGGRVSVCSRLGVGSTFSFTVPAADPH